MLCLGFYTKITDVNSLITCLKRSLKSIIHDEKEMLHGLSQMSKFSNKYEEYSNADLLVDCKKKICDILMNITTLKSDLELRLFLNKLKEIAITQEAFKKLSKTTLSLKDKGKIHSHRKRSPVFATSDDS